MSIDPTEALANIARRFPVDKDRPSGQDRIDAVSRCVKDGADVNHTVNGSPVYLSFIEELSDEGVECFKCCLQSANPIDFTPTDFNSRTVAHLIAVYPNREKASEMLAALVRRLQEHPEDKMDWTQKGGFPQNADEEEWGEHLVEEGHDCVNYAAWFGRLSLFWEGVEGQVPYYDDLNPVPILVRVFPCDWERIPEEKRVSLNCTRGMLSMDEALYRLHWTDEPGFPEVATVQACIDAGGDPNYLKFGDEYTVFNSFLVSNKLECFKACLTTTLPINFDIMDGEAEFALMNLGSRGSDEAAVEMLKAIVERLRPGSDHYNPKDEIDWGLENSIDQSFKSEALKNNRWSLFWPIVKDIPYFKYKTDVREETG